MSKEEILKQVEKVFRSVLDDETLVLTMETTADDVEDWDSLSHIQLVVGLEKHFHVKFNAREIMEWENIGGIVDSIAAKLKQMIV